MKPLLLASLSAIVLLSNPSPVLASSSLGYRRALECGKSNIRPTDVFDGWTGFVIDTTLPPSSTPDAITVAEAKRIMRASSDPCQKIVARLMARDNVQVEFRPFQNAAPGFSTEAGFSWKTNTILVNSNQPYMHNAYNLATRFVHEYFHRVQHSLGLLQVDKDGFLIGPESQVHDYSHREAILAYINSQSQNEGTCKLDEVPEGCRGIAPNMVHPGQSYPLQPAIRPLRDRIQINPKVEWPGQVDFDQSGGTVIEAPPVNAQWPTKPFIPPICQSPDAAKLPRCAAYINH